MRLVVLVVEGLEAISEEAAGVVEGVDGQREMRVGTVDGIETWISGIATVMTEAASVIATAKGTEIGAMLGISGHVAPPLAVRGHQTEISGIEIEMDRLESTQIGLGEVLVMADPLQQDPLRPTLSSACHRIPVAVDFIVDVAEEEVTGPQIEGGVEDHIWTTEGIATHEAGLKRAAGVGNARKGTAWIEWTDMPTRRPDAIFEMTAILETVNSFETSWKHARMLVTTRALLVKRFRHHPLHLQLPLLVPFRVAL